MVNENNYIGATLTLVGYAAGDPEYPPYDKEGKRGYKQLSIANTEGYKKDGEFVETGTTWYSVVAAGEAAAPLRAIPKGSKIRVDDAKQEVREYESGGKTKLGITLRFGTVTVLEAGNGGAEEPF